MATLQGRSARITTGPDQHRARPVARGVRELLDEMIADPAGEVGPGLHDTARLVALTPWLTGHRGRIGHLCLRQRPDGRWGETEDGYAMVPTLSATEALLVVLRRSDVADDPALTARVARAATRGLRVLLDWLAPDARPVAPDTIAVELLVPALVESINGHLDTPGAVPTAGAGPARLAVPPELAGGTLGRFRAAAAAGLLPPKTWASLEAAGPAAAGAPGVRAVDGAVGCSPAATGAWLGGAPPDGDRAEAAGFLRRAAERSGGPVPGVLPITYFEQSWVLNSLATGGVPHPAPDSILDSLDGALESGVDSAGSPAARGLPADSDDSAGVLLALARHGRPRRPDCLLDFRVDGYFVCFPGERTPSVSTNAHVYEALADHLARRPGDAARFGAATAMVRDHLLSVQRADGSWLDKWHASPWYATLCCALPLARFAPAESGPAVRRAVQWLLSVQRPDGGWGRFTATVEETAYAVQTLTGVADRSSRVDRAVSAGREYLRAHPVRPDHPGLWHAKDLYAPLRVIRAARLAALGAARAFTAVRA